MSNNINNLAEEPKPKSQKSDIKDPPDSKLTIFINGLKTVVEASTEVLVLQHPQEKREELATVAILAKCLPKAIVKVGLSWPNLKKILDKEIDPARWAVIHLGTQADSNKLLEKETPVAMSAPVSGRGGAKNLSDLEGIVVLDGSRREAKALWWRNAWLLKLNRIVLNPTKPSIYNKLRKEPRRESVSTLEAVAMVLAEIENRPEIYEELVTPLSNFISEMGSKRRGNGGPRKDWRRKRRK